MDSGPDMGSTSHPVCAQNSAPIEVAHVEPNPSSEPCTIPHSSAEKQYENMLIEADSRLDQPDSSGDSMKDPSAIACGLILMKCGPPEDGYDGLSAVSVGAAIRRAVMSYWHRRGVTDDFIKNPDGTTSGNPGKNMDLQIIIAYLHETQQQARANIPRRAYQETHEDVRAIYYKFVKPQLTRAIRRDPTVNYAALQTACINMMQFSAVCQHADLLALEVRDLQFTATSVDSPIIGCLPTTKNGKPTPTYMRFTKGMHVSICGLQALQGWLCVLDAHEVADGKLFLKVESNVLQDGTELVGESYGRGLRVMGQQCGISLLSADSGRRGGLGFLYFVLRQDLMYLRMIYGWENLCEMCTYLGVEDRVNSYAVLGFTGSGTEYARMITSDYDD